MIQYTLLDPQKLLSYRNFPQKALVSNNWEKERSNRRLSYWFWLYELLLVHCVTQWQLFQKSTFSPCTPKRYSKVDFLLLPTKCIDMELGNGPLGNREYSRIIDFSLGKWVKNWSTSLAEFGHLRKWPVNQNSIRHLKYQLECSTYDWNDSFYIILMVKWLPKATLALVASWLIQNETQESITIKIDGRYVWNTK